MRYTKVRHAPNVNRWWCERCGRLCRRNACDHCSSKRFRFDARVAAAFEQLEHPHRATESA